MSGWDFEHRGKPRHAHAYRLIERFLSVMAILGLACLCIGLILFISGKALNNLTVARIGVYILLIGILFVVVRLFYWIAAKMVERA